MRIRRDPIFVSSLLGRAISIPALLELVTRCADCAAVIVVRHFPKSKSRVVGCD
jgi:hypothetical protein